MHIFEDGGYCFSCGWIDRSLVGCVKKSKFKDDIKEQFEYINSLPIEKIRGLYFPRDDFGYYFVFPNDEYYVKRMFGEKTRYLYPKGHSPPLLQYKRCPHKLALIEGYINARSVLASNCTTDSIASFGSATTSYKYLQNYLNYSEIHVIVDKDKAGVANGVKLKESLLRQGKRVKLSAVDQDFNEQYQKSAEEVKKWFKENV